jgi:hypothetical protein
VSRRAFSLVGLVAGAVVLAAMSIQPAVGAGRSPGPPTSTEMQVNQVFAGPFATNRTAEPSIAQNPTNPLNLIVGSGDEIAQPPCTDTTPSDCSITFGISVSGFYASFDGGTTFPCQGLLQFPGSGQWAEGDPWVVFDSVGNAYYGTLALPNVDAGNSTADIFVAKSTDGGCTWPTFQKVSGASPAIYDDKPSLAADAHPSSPFRDYVYASWTKFVALLGADQIMFSRSRDGGVTWDKPHAISNASPVQGRIGAVVDVGPDGTVYVVWADALFSGTTLKMAISHDGGKTFPRSNVAVATVNDDLVTGELPGTLFLSGGILPDMAIGPDGAIYVVYSGHANGHAPVSLVKSIDGGLTWSVPVAAADIAGRSGVFQSVSVDPAGRISVAVTALDDVPDGTPAVAGAVFGDTYWAQSVDGGLTFSAPLRLSAVSSDPAASSTLGLGGEFIGDYITVATDSSHAYVVWTDARNAATCPAVDAWRLGTGPKPNVIDECLVNFGNTDIFLATVST